MKRRIKIPLILIGLVAVALWFSLPSGDDPEAINSGVINTMFVIMYLLLGVAVATTLTFALTKVFSHPKNTKKTAFALGALAIVVAISYGLSTDNEAVVTAMAERGVETTEATVKTIGMGLNVFFILTLTAVVLMVIPSIKKMLAK